MHSLLMFLVFAAVIAIPVAAKDKKHDTHSDVIVNVKVKSESDRRSDVRVVQRFSDNDRTVITTYFSKQRKGRKLPPGLAKKLSPAQERLIVVNHVLPLDIYQLAMPMPIALIPLLPPPPPGMMLMTLSGKAITVDIKTRIVADCFDLGF